MEILRITPHQYQFERIYESFENARKQEEKLEKKKFKKKLKMCKKYGVPMIIN